MIRIAEVLGVEPAELVEDTETEKDALLARLDELTEDDDPLEEKLAELRADIDGTQAGSPEESLDGSSREAACWATSSFNI